MKHPFVALMLVYGVLVRGDESPDEYSLRLFGGESPLDGIPEIYMYNWRQICDADITPTVAEVICRSLGYPPAEFTLKNDAYKTNQAEWLQCEGSEEQLQQCNWQVWSKRECPDGESLGMTCTGDMRLYDVYKWLARPSVGEIQIYRDGTWNSICDQNPNHVVGEVICRHMDLTEGSAVLQAYTYNIHVNLVEHYYHMSCIGNETRPKDCEYIKADDNADCKKLYVDCNVTESVEIIPDTVAGNAENGTQFFISVNGSLGMWCENMTMIEAKIEQDMLQTAAVICHEIGLSRYGATLLVTEYNEEYDDVDAYTVFPFLCDGTENTLSQCPQEWSIYRDSNVCNKSRIGVVCNMHIRLQNGTSDSNGRVELLDQQNGEWYTIVDTNRDHAMAQVICRELGFYSTNVSMRHGSTYGEADTLPRQYRYFCSGEETYLKECEMIEYNGGVKNSLAVDCNVDTLESYSTCGDFMNDTELLNLASVLCYQRYYSRFNAISSNVTGIHMVASTQRRSEISCIGTENSIGECSRGPDILQSEPCSHQFRVTCEDIGTLCEESLPREVEIIACYKCSLGSCQNTEKVLCNIDKGESCMVEKTSFLSYGSGWNNIYLLACETTCIPEYTEDTYSYRSRECCNTHLCNSVNTVTRTEHEARLSQGTLPSDGIVEVFHFGSWSYVKDEDISDSKIKSLCQKAGYFGSNFVKMPAYGSDDVLCVRSSNKECRKQKNNIEACGWVKTTCSRGELLRINCHVRTPPMRLVDGPSPAAGRVEVYHNDTWGTICSHGLSKGAGNVICASLGFSTACSSVTMTEFGRSVFRSGVGPIHFTDLNCVGNERNILFCNYNLEYATSGCSHTDDVGLICENHDRFKYFFASSTSNVILQTTGLDVTESVINTITTEEPAIACYDGGCSGQNCLEAPFNSSKCQIDITGRCFIERTNTRSIIDEYRFGCTNFCIRGLIRRPFPTPGFTFTHCCSGDLCNLDLESRISVTNITDEDSLVIEGEDEATTTITPVTDFSRKETTNSANTIQGRIVLANVLIAMELCMIL